MCGYLLGAMMKHQHATRAAGISDLDTNWTRLARKGDFLNQFQYILADETEKSTKE